MTIATKGNQPKNRQRYPITSYPNPVIFTIHPNPLLASIYCNPVLGKVNPNPQLPSSSTVREKIFFANRATTSWQLLDLRFLESIKKTVWTVRELTKPFQLYLPSHFNSESTNGKDRNVFSHIRCRTTSVLVKFGIHLVPLWITLFLCNSFEKHGQ